MILDKKQKNDELNDYIANYFKYEDQLLDLENELDNVEETDDEVLNLELSRDVERDIDNTKYLFNESKSDLMCFVLEDKENFDLFKKTPFYTEDMFYLLNEMNEQYASYQDAF